MKFNLPAPSSVEWYRSGVPGGGQRDHIFNRLKAKLIGGKDDSGTSYFKMHDRKLSNSDADKIIANMKQDEDGYPTFSTGSTSGEAEREYQEWIIDRYLVDATPTAKPPEDIPVEVEVVEVEQKTVDEPIVVKIEAPFEPEPQKKLEAPKRIRLPRRSGVMKARPIGPPKKSVASRMADAFDKRLDDLVDAVQNPPAPAPPKHRKQKESLYKIKKKVKPAKFKSNYKEKGNVKPFENLGKFTFNKVRSALGRAADARRMAQEQGLPEQEKGFYAFKALGFEFGGDRIARTRGTFSKSPDATLDPSLSKQQRYTEGLFGTRSIRSKSAVGTRSKGGDGGVKQLDASFNKLTKQFDKVINLKKQNPSSSKDTAEFNKVVEELKEALQKGNKYQKEINAAKKQQAKIAADAANDAKAAAEEESLEQTRDSAGLSEIVKKQKKEKKEKRDGGFNPFDFLKRFKGLRKLWRRIRNPVKTFKAVKRLVGQKINKALRPVKELTENVAKKGKKFVDGATELGKRLKGGAIETAGKATDAVKGGIGKIGGWLSKAGDAIKGGAVKTWEVTKSVGGWIGAKIQKTADLIASAPGKVGQALRKMGVPKNWDELVKLLKSPMAQKALDMALGPVGKYVKEQLTNPKSILKIAQRGIMNAKVQKAIIKNGTEKLLTKVLGKLGLKVGGQAVPIYGQVANLAYGVVEAIVRGALGDWKGAALSLGGAIPWVGAGFSIVDIIRDIDIDAYTKHIEPNLGGIAMGNSEPLVAFFNQVAGLDITSDLEGDPPPEPKPEDVEKPAANPGETKPEEKLSAGGVVPAMVGEAGPELVMGPGGGGFNPLQSLAPMIVAMREVTKRAGTWADPIENMVRQVTDPIAKQLKLPVLPTAVEIGKGVGSEGSGKKGKKRKKKGLGGGLASLLDDIGKLLNGGSEEGTPGTSNGSDAGGFKELLDMIAGVESTSSGGYNAFNTGGSDGGHTAHGSGDSASKPIDGVVKPLTQRTVGEVMRLQAAGKLHATGRYQIIQITLKGLMEGRYGETGVSENDLYDAVTQDKLGIALIKNRLRTGANLTNFRNEWIGLHNVDDAKLQGAIDRAKAFNEGNPNFRPSATQGVEPNPGGAMPMTAKTKVVGDSIANGFAGAAGRSKGLTTVGHSPDKVLNTLKSNVNSSNTSNVVLSTGLSNNTSMKAQAEKQMQYLQSQGIAFTVLPVSNAISAANGNLNQWLADKARQYGGSFASGAQFNHASGDTTRAHPETYLPMVRAVTLGVH